MWGYLEVDLSVRFYFNIKKNRVYVAFKTKVLPSILWAFKQLPHINLNQPELGQKVNLACPELLTHDSHPIQVLSTTLPSATRCDATRRGDVTISWVWV